MQPMIAQKIQNDWAVMFGDVLRKEMDSCMWVMVDPHRATGSLAG